MNETTGMEYRELIDAFAAKCGIEHPGGEDGVAFADLTPDNIQQFVLKDENGEEIPLYCWSWWGVGYSDEKGFFTEESQEGFSLMYFLPDGVNAEDLVLSVEAGTAE